MLIKDIINETTSSGGIASVAVPMNSDIIKRPGPVVKKKKKKTTEDQVPYLQRPNSPYELGKQEYLRKNPGKTEEDFKELLPNQQNKYLDKYVEGKSPHKKGTKKYKKHMAAMHAG